MGSLPRARITGVLVALAIVAVACGGRVSQEQVLAEARADGVLGSGSASNLTDGDGALPGDPGFTGSATGDPSGGTGPSSGGGGGANPLDPANTVGTAPPAPAGGNGGATDVGVTAEEIKIGTVITLSGPVPGLFRGALIGTQAYFAYQNSLGGLYGRKFTVVPGDDGLDTGKNRAQHVALKDKVFAFVGSFSVNDSGGIPELKSSGAPDIGRALTHARQELPNHYSPVAWEIGWPTTGANFLIKRFGLAKLQNLAFLWGNVDAARTNHTWQQYAFEKMGMKFVYEAEVGATEANYGPYIVEMRRRGVDGILFVHDVSNIAKLFADMEQQGFDPLVKYPTASAYDTKFVDLAGGPAATEGILIGQNIAMYAGEDAANIPEDRRFLEWMRKIDPKQPIDIFSLYGWTSAKLTVQAMQSAGPRITRAALLDALSKIHSYDGGGLHQAGDVGRKHPLGACEMYMEIRGGKFHRVFPAQGYSCDGKFVYYPQ